MLPKENRLPSSQIKTVMRQGRRVNVSGSQIVFLRRPSWGSPQFFPSSTPRKTGDPAPGGKIGISPPTRFAFVVSKNVDKRAVGRNRLKRLTRESVRLAFPDVTPGWDGVFMVRKGLGDEFASVNACVRDLLMRSKILS